MGEHAFMEEYVRPPEPPSPRGFSLAALFLLLTTAGVVAALARNASLNTNFELNERGKLVFAHAAFGALVGAAVGFFVGRSYPRRRAGGMIGASVGAFSGGICAGVAAAGASFWLFVVGAVALLSLGILSRVVHRRD